MIKFAHVGFPKCASTWLQSHVFTNHQEIFFLGRKPGDNILNDEIRTLFWSTLIDSREFSYDKAKTQGLLAPLIKSALLENKIAIGLSLEQLLHAQIGRLEFSERAKRLKDFLGDGAKIIIVVREQSSWIKSYYSNLVSEAGLRETFDTFKGYFFAEHDVSPLSTLFFDKVYEVYAELFGAENVKVVPMELLKSDKYKFANDILEFIGVSPIDNVSSEAKNASVSEEHFAVHQYLNNQKPFRLGRSNAIHRAFGWQVRSLYNQEKYFEFPSTYTEDQNHYLRNWNVESFLSENPQILKNINRDERKFTPLEMGRLYELYHQSNAKLEELCGIRLGQYGYFL